MNSYDNIIYANHIEDNEGTGLIIADKSGSINKVSRNNFERNRKGILLYSGANFNDIFENNFKNNPGKHAEFNFCMKNYFKSNYWDNWNLKNIPKPIFGIIGFPIHPFPFPWVTFDRRPVTEEWAAMIIK